MERLSGDAQSLGRSSFTARRAHGIQNHLTLEEIDGLIHITCRNPAPQRLLGLRKRSGAPDVLRKHLDADRLVIVTRKRRHPFNLIFEFPDIPGPVISDQAFHRGIGEARQLATHPRADFVDKVMRQRRNILAPFPKRWNANLDHPHPIIKIFPKATLFDLSTEFAMSRRDHANRALNGVG